MIDFPSKLITDVSYSQGKYSTTILAEIKNNFRTNNPDFSVYSYPHFEKTNPANEYPQKSRLFVLKIILRYAKIQVTFLVIRRTRYFKMSSKDYPFQPRVIRANLAAGYLGMDRNRFNREVKPYLVVVPIGVQGVGYDRLDLDDWWEEYKRRNGQPGALWKEGEELWENECQVFTAGRTSPAVCGTLTKSSTANAFAKAVERATKKKRKVI